MAAIKSASFGKAACLIGLGLMAGCSSVETTASIEKPVAKAPAPIAAPKKVYTYTTADRECLKRAMYFESQRSSRDGMLAVGSVVMNRLTSGAYSDSICGVVAQKRQFAPGVMTRKMHDSAQADLDEAADAVLRGERNPQVKEAMFFHTDGLKFPYDNMHYVAVAGGNAFYEKRDEDGELQTPPPKSPKEYILAFAPHLASEPGLAVVNDMGASSVMTQASYTAPQADNLVMPLGAPVPMQRPPEATFPPAPQPVSVAAMSAPGPANAGPAPSTQIYTAAQPDNFALPPVVPVPGQRPQVASIMQASQQVSGTQQVWSARPANRP